MFKQENVLGIITARHGSKGIPGKNLAILNGKPLIYWSIAAGQKCQSIDRLILSTDSKEIANTGKAYNVDIPFIRPDNLATDEASSIDVIKHAIDQLTYTNGYIVLLQPTSPLRIADDIDKAFDKLKKTGGKAIISVTETDHNPLLSGNLPEDHSMKDFIKPEFRNSNRQSLNRFYRLNGAVYIAETAYFIRQNGFWGDETYAYIMPGERSIDIDNPLDFKLAELIMSSNPVE